MAAIAVPNPSPSKTRPPHDPEDPGVWPTIDPDTATRRKWAKAQLALDKKLLKRGWWFDAAEADRACTFFEQHCRHSKGEWAGLPLLLAPWQRRIIRRLFGWKQPDGTRRYRKCHLKVGRKNGKSLIAAGIGLYLTCCDREPGADVYSAANDKEQARIVHREAIKMVKASPALKTVLETFTDAIVMPLTLSSYKPLSADGQNKDGLNIHGIIRDEIHEWTDRDFVTKLRTAMGARRQPLTFDATTAGDDPNSIWGEEDQYAHLVAEGRYEDAEYLSVLYEAELKDNWKDERTWRKANPNLGVSPKLAFLQSEFQEALKKPGNELDFKRYYLNLLTQKLGRWMRMSKWDECGKLRSPAPIAPDEKSWLGLDLATRTDFTAAVEVIKRGELLLVIPKFWIPESEIENKERKEKIPIRLWIEQGLVEATPGDIIDYAYPRDYIVGLSKTRRLMEVAFDPNGATQLALQLQDEDGITMVEHGQAIMKMSEPTKALEAAVLTKCLVHCNNPVLRWMASNAVAYYNANNDVKLLKQRSAGRIDGIVALIMAISRATLQTEFKSTYEQGGVKEF